MGQRNRVGVSGGMGRFGQRLRLGAPGLQGSGQCRMGDRVHGFTTIELLVAVSIVLLLLAVAMASYMEHVTRKGRAQARSALIELAEGLQLQHQRTGSYAGEELPITQSPREGDARYRIRLLQVPVTAQDPKALFPASSAAVFTLQAEPLADDDPCGTLLLDNTGRRGVMGAGATLAECWPK